MSSIRTIGRWIHLPSDPTKRFGTNEPLGAGLMQICSSNALHAARENGMRTLWEHPGVTDVAGDLYWGTDPSQFPWGSDPSASTPAVFFAGTHLIRERGETGNYPSIQLTCDLSTNGTGTAGIIIVARTDLGQPTSSDSLIGYNTTTSNTPTTLVAVIDLVATRPAPTPREFSPRIGVSLPATTNAQEFGIYGTLSLYVGVWATAGGKSSTGAMTITMKPNGPLTP